ncbi:MAG: hypothetical protein M1825_000504 [Sarcosagium campestre]|nr:MAG: hypothetical protein M1825_000504 [Sarcosagium campestre]
MSDLKDGSGSANAAPLPTEPTEPPPSYDAVSQQDGPAPAAAHLKRPPPPLRAPLPLDLPALNLLRGRRVILASASPRRKQLLAQIGLHNVQVVPSNTAEDFPKSLSPFEYCLQTASQKVMTVYEKEINNEAQGEPALVIAADTVVVSHVGDILEKPRSEKDHIAMLKALRAGPSHKVYTAIAVMAPLEAAVSPGYAMETDVVETVVRFDPNITDDLLLAYVKTREGVDKAGGYGIQGMGSLLVERIEGTFDNVVGLPLRATLKLIEKVLIREDHLDEADEAEED